MIRAVLVNDNGETLVYRDTTINQATELLKLSKEVDEISIGDNLYKFTGSALTISPNIDKLEIFMEEENND